MELKPVSMQFEALNMDARFDTETQHVFVSLVRFVEALEYAHPRQAAMKIWRRCGDQIGPEHSVVAKLGTTDGKEYETRLIDKYGAYIVALKANTEKAKAVQNWVTSTMISLEEGAIRHRIEAMAEKIEVLEKAVPKDNRNLLEFYWDSEYNLSKVKRENLALQKEAQEARNALVYFDYRRMDYAHLLQFARENDMPIKCLRRTPAGRVFHATFQVPSHMWY